jgi:medium-chain acyl-[acyl-carrier-protein] hydrolase
VTGRQPSLRVLARPPRGGPARLPVLCVPFSGGGGTAYDSWSGLLPRDLLPLTLRLPGREARFGEELPTDLRALATDIGAELAPHLSGPFAVFGHSMGAILAYELTRALQTEHAITAQCLVVSGAPAPDRFAARSHYSGLDDGQLRAALTAMGGSRPGVLEDPELWALFAPIIRADLMLCETYVFEPGEPLAGPLVAYGSRDDPDVDQPRLDDWARFSTGPFESRLFPGDHFYFQHWPEAFAMDLINRLHRHVGADR